MSYEFLLHVPLTSNIQVGLRQNRLPHQGRTDIRRT
jgi:hypothetical protein